MYRNDIYASFLETLLCQCISVCVCVKYFILYVYTILINAVVPHILMYQYADKK